MSFDHKAWYRKNRKRLLFLQKQYRERNKDAVKERNTAWKKTDAGKACARRGYLRYAFGISLSDYTAMAVAQGGVCAICAQGETRKDRSGNIKPLSVDHDHQTGAIRGLLCDGCNNAIGNIRDNPQTARAIARYLEGESKIVKLVGGL